MLNERNTVCNNACGSGTSTTAGRVTETLAPVAPTRGGSKIFHGKDDGTRPPTVLGPTGPRLRSGELFLGGECLDHRMNTRQFDGVHQVGIGGHDRKYPARIVDHGITANQRGN